MLNKLLILRQTNKKIAILGFSFKANTNDIRESPSIDITKNLLLEKAFVSIHDPKVQPSQIERCLGRRFDNPKSTIKKQILIKENLTFDNDIDSCLLNADAAIIMTEWEEYKKIKWKSYENKMNKPGWVFDTRYILKEKDFEDSDLNFWQIGNI